MEAEGITSSKDRLEEGVIDEDSKWYKLIDEFNAAIFRLVFLLQGLLSGLLVMIAIQYLFDDISISVQKYGFRLNQTVWILSLICFFGQLYIYRVSSQRFLDISHIQGDYSFRSGSPTYQENRNYKVRAFINMMVISYYDGKISVKGSTDQTKQNSYENGYKVLIAISAVASVIGWFIVGNQTKSNYIEMEYDEDDRTNINDDSDEDI